MSACVHRRLTPATILTHTHSFFKPYFAFYEKRRKCVPIFGTLFVGLLKGVAPVLVFVLVISALANAAGDIGGRFKNVIFLYVLGILLIAIFFY